MLIIGSRRIYEINQLGLSPNVKRLTNGEHVHELLDDDCRQVEEGEEYSVCPDGLEVVPLWEGHSSVTGFYSQQGVTEFIRYEKEYPNEYEMLGTSIYAVITKLLAWYWSEREATDAVLREVARLLEYPYIERFLKEIEIANENIEIEPMGEWEKRFRGSL